MSKSDQGYKPAKASSYSGGYGRSRSVGTYIAQASKNELVSLNLHTTWRGILDVLGIERTSEQAMAIRRGLVEEQKESKMTKHELYMSALAEQQGAQAVNANRKDIERLESAKELIAALESTTRAKSRENLDDGDDLDDPVSLMMDGAGWAEDVIGASQYKKHVNICIDNSGSTRMPETGFCSLAMEKVSQNLVNVLYEAAERWQGVSWDVFSFNRVTQQETGWRAKHLREQQVRQQLEEIEVDNPHMSDATETNLAPLLEAIYANEEERSLIDQPRLDIILTDGEFESQADADDAAVHQAKRGSNVSTYVINLCPDKPSDITLPTSFRVIPLPCIEEKYGALEVDNDMLRQVIMQIVVEEVQKIS